MNALTPPVSPVEPVANPDASSEARTFLDKLFDDGILMPSGVFALIAAQQAGCGVVAALVPSATGAS